MAESVRSSLVDLTLVRVGYSQYLSKILKKKSNFLETMMKKARFIR